MSIIKRGTVDSSIVVSSSVYSCNNCGHTEIVKRASRRSKKCPKCQEDMQIMSSQTESIDKENDNH